MPCDHFKLPGGGAAIVCSRRAKRMRCVACFAAGGYQCDWKLPGGKTCDAHICPTHALKVGDDKHLCPLHQEAYEAWKAKRA